VQPDVPKMWGKCWIRERYVQDLSVQGGLDLDLWLHDGQDLDLWLQGDQERGSTASRVVMQHAARQPVTAKTVCCSCGAVGQHVAGVQHAPAKQQVGLSEHKVKRSSQARSACPQP